MARAYHMPEEAELSQHPAAGEWQALRGELVALLDKVESRYGQAAEAEPAGSALSQRVRNLRDQVNTPEPHLRRREALRSVKRAVDRFSERDVADFDEEDDLTAAIAEIRSRQGVAPQHTQALGRRVTDMPEFRELGSLVSGMSHRLERLEGDLKSQRAGAGQVREVASQVEQLTQVVELLAGAVGETGQVKRLETQIAALASMIEHTPQVDLSAINKRLDDVSATVGKLAELQAEQMEREFVREEHRSSEPNSALAAALVPAMDAIESSVRNVYDRIDAIERSVAMSSGDFEKLTSEMAAFTQAMKSGSAAPAALIERVERLADRLDGLDTGNGEIAGLKADISALRDSVLQSMEPRFSRIEGQIESLSTQVSAVDTGSIEHQLKALMARMDDAGAQLDGLARLYAANEERPDFESLATLVAERTSEAVTRKAPAPVAMFGADSLKSIEDRITGLIKSAGKTPDYETLADMVATRTSDAVAKSASQGAGGLGEESLTALERRMEALLNTAGKDTAERLKRLEAALIARQQDGAPRAKSQASTPATPAPKPASPAQPAAKATEADNPFVLPATENARLDGILANLKQDQGDSMPSNPADDAPLIDKGFKDNHPVRSALAGRSPRQSPASGAVEDASGSKPMAPAVEAPHFDPSSVERPPRPQSSFAPKVTDPFAAPAEGDQPVEPDGQKSSTSTSTFVAAARRAQRARQEPAPAAESNSLIGRALSRVRAKPADASGEVKKEPAAKRSAKAAPSTESVAEAAIPAPGKAEKPARTKRRAEKVKAPALPASGEADPRPGFLTRHRRPLLLAATLVAVSMLALNLVLQRMGPSNVNNSTPAPAASSTAVTEPNVPATDATPEAAGIVDDVDPTSTQSINPGAPMSFSKPVAETPMPPTLIAGSNPATTFRIPDIPSAGVSAETTGSINASAAGAAPAAESFALPPEAVGPEALRQAAADGDAHAQFEVAAIYTEGRAISQDLAEAAKWYERAAAHGFAPAQYRLGNLYEAGTGVEKNLETAKLWYQRAAESGNRMAMHNLAALYAGGQLGEQQFEQAAQWFEQAANRGMTDSQFNLGMLYARGLGVEQDFERSFKWFSLAARTGDKDAAQARDDIAKSLTADAVSRVNDELKVWTPQAIDLESNFAPIGTWSTSFDPGETITSKEVISKVQTALTKLGFDVGSPDGVAGPKTSDAIRAFERGTGMSESGKINPRLLAVLGSQPV